MFTPIPYSYRSLDTAQSRLQEGSPLSVRDHNAVVITLGAISDAMADPARHFDSNGSLQFPMAWNNGVERRVIGLESEPVGWWNPAMTESLVTLQRNAFRGSQYILTLLNSGRAMAATRAAGSLDSQYAGLTEDQIVLAVNKVAQTARVADDRQTMVYDFDVETHKKIGYALKYISWAANYVADATNNTLNASSELFPAQGRVATDEFAEIYKNEMIRNYWIMLGIYGLAIAGSFLAAYMSEPHQLDSSLEKAT